MSDATTAGPAAGAGGEKLSAQIASVIGMLDGSDVLTGDQVAQLVAFNRPLLRHLAAFAADYEFAERHRPSPKAVSIAAAASLKLYRRLERSTVSPTPATPAGREIAAVVDLSAYRAGRRP